MDGLASGKLTGTSKGEFQGPFPVKAGGASLTSKLNLHGGFGNDRILGQMAFDMQGQMQGGGAGAGIDDGAIHEIDVCISQHGGPGERNGPGRSALVEIGPGIETRRAGAAG